MGKTKKMRRLILFVLISMYVIPLHSVAFATEEAKTPPPPTEIGIMGAFDPNHVYLEDGYSIFSNLGNGDIKISAVTKGKTYVETLGVKMKLQKWTGFSWIDIYTSPSYADTDTRLIEAYAYLTVDTGYYYRIISTHWAEQDGVYEQGIVNGNTVLVN